MNIELSKIESFKELISKKHKQIAIIPHRNVDGDAMGSTLGLWHVLKQIQDNVKVVVPNEIPEYLQWIPGTDETIILEGENYYTTRGFLEKCDLVFTLDFNAFHRTGDQMEMVLNTLKTQFVMIDHHEKPDNYAKITFSDTEIGSTCQMVYHIIEQSGFKHLINLEAATCLYTGIATDSGGFRFPRTTGITHRVVAELIDLGVDNTKIYTNLYDNSNYNRLQLLGKALQNLKIYPELNASTITLSQEELDLFNYEKGDTEGIVNYGLTLKGIYVTAFFTEIKDEKMIKISFRSQGNFDVNKLARNYFNGGGHINAAGGKSFDTMEETVQKFISTLAELNK